MVNEGNTIGSTRRHQKRRPQGQGADALLYMPARVLGTESPTDAASCRTLLPGTGPQLIPALHLRYHGACKSGPTVLFVPDIHRRRARPPRPLASRTQWRCAPSLTTPYRKTQHHIEEDREKSQIPTGNINLD